MRTAVGLPPDFTPVGVIPVGRPLEDVKSPSLKRGWRPLDESAHWESWEGDLDGQCSSGPGPSPSVPWVAPMQILLTTVRPASCAIREASPLCVPG